MTNHPNCGYTKKFFWLSPRGFANEGSTIRINSEAEKKILDNYLDAVDFDNDASSIRYELHGKHRACGSISLYEFLCDNYGPPQSGFWPDFAKSILQNKVKK
jgi:hypothetical protein